MNKKEKEALYPRAMQLKDEDPGFFRLLKRNRLALIDFFMTSSKKLRRQREIYEDLLNTQKEIADAFKAYLEEEQLKNKVLVEENRRLKETIRKQNGQKNENSKAKKGIVLEFESDVLTDLLNLMEEVIFHGEE